MPKDVKRKLLKLDCGKKKEQEQNLNSSKEMDGTVYYSLEDVEIIVQAVLVELSSDPTVGVTIEPSETGVVLNCAPESGDEYTVDVDLNTETLVDDAPEGEAPAAE